MIISTKDLQFTEVRAYKSPQKLNNEILNNVSASKCNAKQIQSVVKAPLIRTNTSHLFWISSALFFRANILCWSCSFCCLRRSDADIDWTEDPATAKLNKGKLEIKFAWLLVCTEAIHKVSVGFMKVNFKGEFTQKSIAIFSSGNV